MNAQSELITLVARAADELGIDIMLIGAVEYDLRENDSRLHWSLTRDFSSIDRHGIPLGKNSN